MPLPLGEVAECSECLKGRNTRENILPLPLGEVAERSEDGEGKRCKALSVSCGDSSPRGRAKCPLSRVRGAYFIYFSAVNPYGSRSSSRTAT